MDTIFNIQEALTSDLTKAIDPKITVYANRETIRVQYGNAHIEFDKSYYSRVASVRGRKEGVGKFQDMVTLTLPEEGWYEALLAFVVEVLSTGRTCEVGKGAGLPDRNSLMPRYETCDIPLDGIAEHIEGICKYSTEREPWNLNPDYQRGHVWTERQAETFVGFWIEGGNVPLIFVQRYRDGANAPTEQKKEYWKYNEVVDGQQRLRALYRWFVGEIQAETHDGSRYWYADTNEIERRLLPNVKIAFIDIPRLERLRFYLLLNNGGTVHTQEEIQRVKDLLAAEGGKL